MKHSSKRRWIAILWPSFVCAGIFSGLFFAFVDPLAITHEIGVETSPRLAGYSITFIFFWIMSAVSTYAAIAILQTDEPDTPALR